MKRYWLLFGFVLCVSLLFAQNGAGSDTSVKLESYQTHPKVMVPEEVELEPDTEPVKIEGKEINKPSITIKEESQASINHNVIQAQPKQEPKIDIKQEPIINNSQSMKSLYDYAKQLEKTGNKEAATAVYKLIIKGGGTELIQKAHEDIPIIEAVDELKQIDKVFTHKKGSKGK